MATHTVGLLVLRVTMVANAMTWQLSLYNL